VYFSQRKIPVNAINPMINRPLFSGSDYDCRDREREREREREKEREREREREIVIIQ